MHIRTHQFMVIRVLMLTLCCGIVAAHAKPPAKTPEDTQKSESKAPPAKDTEKSESKAPPAKTPEDTQKSESKAPPEKDQNAKEQPLSDVPSADEAAKTTPPAGMMLTEKERAVELARKAAEYAANGQYAEAASKFQQSLLVFAITDNYYNLAYVYEQMGQWKGCVDNYTLYLTRYQRDHDGAEPPEVAGIKRSIEKCEETAQPPISITTAPSGAQVAIDTVDKVLGSTPLKQKLSPGTYSIFIKKDGYVPVETKIVVQPKQEGKFHFELKQEEKKGKVQITVNVKEATIYIDGKNYGLSPYLETPELEVGRHQLVVKKDLYTSVNATFEVKRGEVTDLSYDMYLTEPPPSWRSYLGWTFVSLGALAVSGGAIAYYFAEQKYNDTKEFRDMELLQNLGYGVGGGLIGLGISLLIWEAVTDAVDENDLISFGAGGPTGVMPTGVSVSPLSGGGVFVSGGLVF